MSPLPSKTYLFDALSYVLATHSILVITGLLFSPLAAPAQTPQIILLREGTDDSQGKPQLISNINACVAVVDAVRTTLGPRGMDKLMVDNKVGPSRPSFLPWFPS